jgi:hypothetical protein
VTDGHQSQGAHPSTGGIARNATSNKKARRILTHSFLS